MSSLSGRVQMTYFLGLTGGIATGKSTADTILREQDIPIIDADLIAHQLMLPNEKNYEAIVNKFGKEILSLDQTIDRKKLGEIVFNDKMKLTLLNEITHPNIVAEIKRQMSKFRQDHAAIVVLDIPLLFEGKLENLCDGVLLISASEQIQMHRLMVRNNLSEKQAASRIASQMSLIEKKNLADYVIENNGSVAELRKKIAAVLTSLER